jgi:hypothetical protein
MSSCTDCLAGTALNDAATLASLHDNINKCVVCDVGKYADTTGTQFCTDCIAGKSLSDATSTVSLHDQASDCGVCLAGTSSSAGAALCSSCGTGYTSASAGLCVICAAGSVETSRTSCAGKCDCLLSFFLWCCNK